MSLFLMCLVFLFSAIGTQVEMRTNLQMGCLVFLTCTSGLYIAFNLVNSWTVWSKEACDGGAVIYSDHVEEDGLDHLDARHLHEEDAKTRVEEWLSEDEEDPSLNDKYSY